MHFKTDCKSQTLSVEKIEDTNIEIIPNDEETPAATDPLQQKPKKELPPNCFSDGLNAKLAKCFKCCYGNENSKINIYWTKIRSFSYDLAENKNFELFIIIMIVLSSIALVSLFFFLI